MFNIHHTIRDSQHCQRNWDLSKTIPEGDIETLKIAATQCPSKQNYLFYKLNFITNRAIIKNIYENTDGFTMQTDLNKPYSKENSHSYTNSQTLANLLIVIEYVKPSEGHRYRDKQFECDWKKDADQAVGIAGGYLNLTAAILGYKTGFCACLNNDKIKDILNTSNDIALMLGVGYPDQNRNSREHHIDTTFTFPKKEKQPIETIFLF